MVAAEYAATFRNRVRKLVLIDAMGLWHDDAPVADHLLVSPQKLVKLLFHDPSKPEVVAKLAMPSEHEAMNAALVQRFGALASTSHFIHPIPERGLKRRLRRITAETLVLWGAQDALVPPLYAAEFAALIPNARVEMIQKRSSAASRAAQSCLRSAGEISGEIAPPKAAPVSAARHSSASRAPLMKLRAYI